MFRGQLLRVTAGAGDMKNNEMAGKINSELILQDICTRLFAVAWASSMLRRRRATPRY